MKKLEKILLLVLLAALVGRMCGLLWCRSIFALTAWVLSLVYALWGYHYLQKHDTPRWLTIATGIGLATSLAILPILCFARRSLVLELLPILNIALFVMLIIRYLRNRQRGRSTNAEGLLRLRSTLLWVPVCFLAYSPPSALARSVIIALNRGDMELSANMNMIAESEAFDQAFSAGDCTAALMHAERAYQNGRIWLFGEEGADYWTKPALGPVDFGQGKTVDLDASIRRIQAEREREELWKIGGTLDDLYDAHHCLGERAELDGDAALGYAHYRTGDSLYNLIEHSEEGAAKERAWSKRHMARAASSMGAYVEADSLFSMAMDLYEEMTDTVDAGCGWILYDWSRSMALRREWEHSNYFLRAAIGLSERDTTSGNTDEQWFDHRLQLVKNLIRTDSLDMGERILQRCLRYTPADSMLRCEVLVVQGSLQFRQNAFKAADSTFTEAIACLGAIPNAEPLLQLTYLSRGYTRLALAEYAQALEMVDAGEALGSGKHMYSSATTSLLRLRAAIHHRQGRYAVALNEYEICLEKQRAAGSEELGMALSSMADVLLDLAQPERAEPLAEEALAQMVDTITELFPSQTPILNTVAYANYYLGDLDKAGERYAYVMDVCERFSAMNTINYAQALNGLALVEMARSDLKRADTLFANAYVRTVVIHGQEHPFTAQVMINQAELRIKQRRYEEAMSLLLTALPNTIRTLGKDHDQLGDIEQLLGDLALRSREPDKAAVHYTEALRIYLQCFPETHPKVQGMRDRLRS